MQRIVYLDYIRSFSCIMIILMHAPMPGIQLPSGLLAGISFITAPALVLFFMVSGALLLPTKLSCRDFYVKRLTKVIYPTFFWTFFYTFVNLMTGKVHCNELLRIILSIPFSAQGHGILWFMYTLIGLYLLTPIISPWLANAQKKEVEFLLLLWGITLFYPLIKDYLSINEASTGILYYFTGYAGYYLLGYYLHRYGKTIGLWWLFFLLLIPCCFAATARITHIKWDFYSVFWYLSIFTAMMSVFWYLLIQRIDIDKCSAPPYLLKHIMSFSNYTFGIYLIHIFVMRNICWHILSWLGIMNVLQIPLTLLFTLGASYITVACMSRLPFSKYIIGIKK